MLGLLNEEWHGIFDVIKVSPLDIENFTKSLQPQAMVSELERLKCNTSGSVKILQDGLTRFFLKAKDFDSRWSAIDYNDEVLITQSRDNKSDANPNMTKKHCRNHSSKKSKKNKGNSKLYKTTQASETVAQGTVTQHERTGTVTEPGQTVAVNPIEHAETVTTERIEIPPKSSQVVKITAPVPAASTGTIQKLNFTHLNDDTQVTVGMLKQVISELMRSKKGVNSTDSSVSFTSSTAIKHPKKIKKTTLSESSPIRLNPSATDSDSNVQSWNSKLADVFSNSGLESLKQKMKSNHDAKLPRQRRKATTLL